MSLSDLSDNPLISAIEAGNCEGIKNLVKKGADLNQVDGDSWTVLHIAAFLGHVNVINALLDAGAKVDVEDKFGNTPHYYAELWGQEEAAKVLKERS